MEMKLMAAELSILEVSCGTPIAAEWLNEKGLPNPLNGLILLYRINGMKGGDPMSSENRVSARDVGWYVNAAGQPPS